MTISTHAVIGAAIGFHVGSPILGFTLGLLSHFLVDMIPHGDSAISDKFRKEKKKKGPVTYTTIDALIAIYLILGFFNVRGEITTAALSAAIAGSILPDLLIGLYDATKSKRLKWFYDLHFFFHDFLVTRRGDVKLRYSLLCQLLFVVLVTQFII